MLKKALTLTAFLAASVAAMAQQPVKETDGVNGTASLEPARTSPLLSDVSRVVAISPNNTGLPVNLPKIVNKAGASIGGATVKTLTDTITATVAGNSLVVDVCAGEVANGGTIVLTMTETGGSDTWTLAATQAVSTTFACSIYYATNITAGVTAVIATFSGGSSANTTIAMYTWEVSGLIALSPQVLDVTAVGTATSTAPSAGPAQPDAANEYAFAAFGIGTAAQTVTLGGTGTWVNDSGQVNPASASGLFSFVGASQFRNTDRPLTAAGTITSEPWVVVEALFQPVQLSVDGVVQLYDGTTNVKVIAGTNALKTDLSSVAGTATVNGGLAGSLSVGGTVATNVAITDNPLNLGAQAVSSENSAVTTARKVQLVADLVGKLITLPYANPENFVNGTTAAITDTTSTSTIASAGGSLRNYITQCTVTNSHATVGTFVKILDGTTVIWEVYANSGGGGATATFPVPLRGTGATAVNCQPVTTGANVICSCSGYKGL